MTTTATRPPARADPAAPSHPRIRARRIEVRRDEGRRRRNRLMMLVVVLGIVAGLAALTQSPVLDIDRLIVSGASRTSPDTVIEQSGLRRGGAMVDVDGNAVAARLERLPWVEQISVERLWPSTVRIRLSERRPVAQAATGSRWAVVDRTGRVLEVRPGPEPSLVRLLGAVPGPPGSTLSGATRPMLSLATGLGAQTGDAVESIGVTGAELGLVLVGGATVRVGPATEVDAKLYALEAMLAREVPHCLDTIDVRVPSAPVLTRKTGCV